MVTRRQRDIKLLERSLKRFDSANSYKEYFHIGTTWQAVAKMKQELKILKEKELEKK